MFFSPDSSFPEFPIPKLRPITGHKTQREELEKDLSSGNVAHAYLFSGPAHLGKIAVAHEFAWQLLSSGMNEEEAEQVKSQIERLTHPDLLVLDQLWMEESSEDWDVIAKTSNVPQVHRSKKPAAKTDTIGIDDIRALHERLYDTATSPWKCCIIRKVERMQDTAASSLLKLLEEPPQRLVFILTTETPGALLPTMLSRVRQIPFYRLSRKELLPLLAGVPEEDATFILHVASGAPGTVAALRDDPELLRAHRTIHSAAQSFWSAVSLRDRLRALGPLSDRGDEADRLLLHLALTLREKALESPPTHFAALQELTDGLRTNTHRGLLAGRFALAVK